MNHRLDFMAEMESAINSPNAVRGIDVFRIANNLSVKIWKLLESGSINNISIRRLRPTSMWSIETYECTPGIGHEVQKHRWQENKDGITRIIEKARLEYCSVDFRGLVFHSIPGVQSILEDSEGYRLLMTHEALFSSARIGLDQWKDCQLLRLSTEHMMDRTLADEYWRWLMSDAPGQPIAGAPDQQDPEIFITCGELIAWYRHLYGAHSASTHTHQLVAEKLPTGSFFVKPLYFPGRKEYFRLMLGFRPLRKVIVALVILMASELYVALGGKRRNFACWLDCSKSDGTKACDVTTVTSVPRSRKKPEENMFSQVANIEPFIDERARGSYDGFYVYDPS